MAEASTSTLRRSSTVTSTPMRWSREMVVVTSLRCGTLLTVTRSDASSVAARMGSVAFLAPEMRISPCSGTPPVMISLSMREAGRPGGSAPAAPLVGRDGADGKRVDLVAHPFPEAGVDHLVTPERPLPLELRAHDDGLEVGIVVAGHLYPGVGQALFDELRDFLRCNHPETDESPCMMPGCSVAQRRSRPNGCAPASRRSARIVYDSGPACRRGGCRGRCISPVEVPV